MALKLGRGGRHRGGTPTELNETVIHDLQAAGRKSQTGALEVVDKDSHATATLYVFDGGLYSAALDGYVPPMLARLGSSGTLGPKHIQALTDELDGTSDPSQAGLVAARHSWAKVDTLGTMHQEYLLASVGAVLARTKVKTRWIADETTSAFCTLPLPIDSVLDAIRMRVQRMTMTWDGIAADLDPSHARPVPTGTPVPATVTLREARLIMDECDGRRTLDEIAWRLGLTRAEAVHIVGVLVRSDVVRMEAADVPAASPLLWVAEEFGRPVAEPVVAVPVAVDVITAEPAMAEPAMAEPVVVEPVVVERAVRVDDGPAVDVAQVVIAAAIVESVVSDPQPEPEADPEPEPEAAVEPEPQPEPEPVAIPVVVAAVAAPRADAVDPHVLQLRAELAKAQISELQEALDLAVHEEMDAIARAAAIRVRLRTAQEGLAELTGGASGGE